MVKPVIIGNAELWLGDCRDVMPGLGRVDACITDPPYGIGWNTNLARFSGGQTKRGAGRDYGTPIVGDDEPFDPSPLLSFERVVLWGANYFAGWLPIGTTLVWVKRNDYAFGTFLSDAEVAWMKGGQGVYCKRSIPQAMTNDRHHPTQKPVDIMAWCIEQAKTPADGVVLDPYMGSGSTGVACMKLGRRFVGIEIDPAHFATACRRIEDAQRQGDMLLRSGA